MPTKTPSTFTETIVLSVAAARRNGHVLPLSEPADVGAPKIIKLLKRMLDRGLLEERRTAGAKGVWRTDQEGQGYLLRITEAGRQATAAPSSTEAARAEPEVPAPAARTQPAPPRAPAGKLGQVLAAVRTRDGASLDDLVTLTGWQRHTVRASLTRLRQGGVPIELTHGDGQKRYIAGASNAPAQ